MQTFICDYFLIECDLFVVFCVNLMITDTAVVLCIGMGGGGGVV